MILNYTISWAIQETHPLARTHKQFLCEDSPSGRQDFIKFRRVDRESVSFLLHVYSLFSYKHDYCSTLYHYLYG
jgi:hypothetical protein